MFSDYVFWFEQEQMCSMLQAVQQEGAPGGAHENFASLRPRAKVRDLQEALQIFRISQGASYRYNYILKNELSLFIADMVLLYIYSN